MAKSENPKRRRELEAQRERSREEARRRAYRKAVRRRQLIGGGVLVAVVFAVVGAVTMASNDPTKSTTTTTTVPSSSTTTALGNTLPPASLPVVPAGAAITGPTPCPTDAASVVRTTSFAQAPPVCIDTAKDYNATIHTSKGDIKISLLPTAAPQSVNNFVTLARYHYYDGLPITRVVPRGWAEIADPTGTDGTTGPGYTVPSETQPQGSIPTPLIVATLPNATGASGGGLIIGLADQVSGMPKLATQIGNIMDSRVDQSCSGDINKTVQQEIDKAANKQGQPTEVITITGITIEERAKDAPPTTSNCT